MPPTAPTTPARRAVVALLAAAAVLGAADVPAARLTSFRALGNCWWIEVARALRPAEPSAAVGLCWM